MKSIVKTKKCKVQVPKGYRLLRANEIVRETDRRILAGFEPFGTSRLEDTVNQSAYLQVFVGGKPGVNMSTRHPRLFIRKVKYV